MNPSPNSSVAGLATACTRKFNQLMDLTDSDMHSSLVNRAADFQLWVDGVGAVAKPGASLDSRFRDRPNDMAIIKGILVMLIDFLSEVSIEGSSPDTALIDVDSALSNLAMIGVAIRRTGKASRSRRADQSFSPDHYEELRRHLECIVLIKPSEDMLDCHGLNANEAIGSGNLEVVASRLQEMVSRRLGQLGGSNLTEVQLRLIDANLRRRHRFVLAQKRAQHNKIAPQTIYNEETILPEAEPQPQVGDNPTSLKESTPEKSTHDLPEHKPQAPPTIALLSTASTAEGTMRYDPKTKYVPTVAQSQISAVANETEFPTISLQLLDRQIIECPCCCQPLPYGEVTKSTNWRQHLIEDICPYSCVAEQCPTPHLLFATRKAWETHVESDHPCQWKCVACGQDEATFSNVTDIKSHIQSGHQDDLFGQSVSDLIEWSRVQCMGIKSCPLCSDYGPEDSPELVEHVVRHAYDFALRSLPWPRIPDEDLNKPIGVYSLRRDINVDTWFESRLEHSSCDIEPKLDISAFDYADHNDPMKQSTEQEDYFTAHVYFDQHDTDGSRLAAAAEVTEWDPAESRHDSVDRSSLFSFQSQSQILESEWDRLHRFKSSKFRRTSSTYAVASVLSDDVSIVEELPQPRRSRPRDGTKNELGAQVIHRPGAVEVKCVLVDKVHGFWGASEPRTPTTLLVLQFSFKTQKRGRRTVSADIECAFFNSLGLLKNTPQVAKISFDGAWQLDVSKSTSEFQVGPDHIAAGIGTISRVQQKATRNTKEGINITGSIRPFDSKDGINNAATWTLEENPKTEGGVPASMRVGILLRRSCLTQFQCKVKVNAKFDLRTRMEKVFSGRDDEDPILLPPHMPPTNNLMDYDAVNLGTFELSLVEEITLLKAVK